MKLTKKYFGLFQKECKKWIDILELNDCRFDFDFYSIQGVRARCFAGQSFPQRVIAIDLNSCWEPENIQEIKDTAKHEVIHALLGKMRCLACERFVSQESLDDADEEIVRKLEKLL